jgi:hypothetical protein
VWIDAIERKYIEEMGGMNLFFVYGSGDNARVVTHVSLARFFQVSHVIHFSHLLLILDTKLKK